MKKCPFCAEEIHDDAIKCRFCGEFLKKKPQIPWYFRTSTIVVLFLCVGPLVLPLILVNPHYKVHTKVWSSLAVLLFTYYAYSVMHEYTKVIGEYYEIIIPQQLPQADL